MKMMKFLTAAGLAAVLAIGSAGVFADEIEELTKRRARIKAKIDRKGLEF